MKGLAGTIKLDAVPSKDDAALAFEFAGSSDQLAKVDYKDVQIIATVGEKEYTFDPETD